MSGTVVSGISIVYEFASREDRPTYIGLANTLPGIVVSIAPLIGGWLVGAVSYPFMFITAMLTGLAALALLIFAVNEPRKTHLD